MENSTGSIGGSEEIKAYRIHVSSKYLELTRKKLELTRLPREVRGESGTKKSEIEPLVDFWLESYSWRIQETHLNTTLPQFRTSFLVSSGNSKVRIHFLHFKSEDTEAVPLLLVPPFGMTNLSVGLKGIGGVAERLVNGESKEGERKEKRFNVVVPCWAGLGFSDELVVGNGEGVLKEMAKVFGRLMKRLGYEFYVAAMLGPGREATGLGKVDWEVGRLVGEEQWCLGVSFLEPRLEMPKVGGWEWVKFRLAKLLGKGFGYEKVDFEALRICQQRRAREGGGTGEILGIGKVGLTEPNTFSFALCDSPVGTLSLVCAGLKMRSEGRRLSSTEIIDVTQLAWLPGPEAGMRFAAAAMREIEVLKGVKGRRRCRVAVTVFGCDGLGGGEYVCPAWAMREHDVVFVKRVEGKSGIPMWLRVDVVVEGIRGLAREVELLDPRLKVKALEKVVVPNEGILEVGVVGGEGIQSDIESPDTVVVEDEGWNGGPGRR